MEYTLIANSGIQLFTFPVSINTQERFKMWYHEWYDTGNGAWIIDPVYELRTEDECVYYKKKDLHKGGYLLDPSTEMTPSELKEDGILPLKNDGEMCPNVKGDIYSLTFSDKNNKLRCLENVWLPAPYFFKRTPKRFDFGPLNWSRFKLIPRSENKGIKTYDVVLAIDTRAKYERDDYYECPFFRDNYSQDMDFELCDDEFLLMDFCSSDNDWRNIDNYLLRFVHPNFQRVSQIRGDNRRMLHIASYTFLISYLAQNHLFPTLRLYRDTSVESKDVDMVIDIGNSRTTALLIEDNANFNQVRQLELVDFTNMVKLNADGSSIRSYSDPFDMRLAFRKVDFGNIGFKDSRQFVYPSLVRLGREANNLIHLANNNLDAVEKLSTYSSPKRYLWDSKPSKEEWKFLVLEGEQDDHILNVSGITNQLKSDGRIDPEGKSGTSFHYSRRSLMTFAFLEMLVQAKRQINGEKHRSNEDGFGKPSMPRKIKRIIVTCPTAMSKVEREALVHCAKDAVVLLDNFEGNGSDGNASAGKSVEIVPAVRSMKDSDGAWYYDEATCSQLVYMYGEAGHKYKGCCSEFFKLYGKVEDGDNQSSITVGSLDIGAGTSDLMINKYTYSKDGSIVSITPAPKFYDSYYYAGDDMLYALIMNIMILDEDGAFRERLGNLDTRLYRQTMKDFFGRDHNMQTVADRVTRKDFNIQYSIPLMYHFLELLNKGSKDCKVTYDDVFGDCPPNDKLICKFKKSTGIDVRTLTWKFNNKKFSEVVSKEFEPLLRKIATIMYSFACDIVLLSGRPASLPVIRDLFLRYYSVSPNRLIVLNNYYVGDWYPFGENTGYIRNPKTIVAMGGVIAHYASELSNLDKFSINLDKLNSDLKSTINYIEASREGQPIEYVITPDINRGDLIVNTIPTTLNVRQIGLDSYPCRALYSIDFNRFKIGERIRRKAVELGQNIPTDAQVQSKVKDDIDALKRRMPFTVTIDRDADDKENLSLSAVVDKNGNDVADGNIEIHIQSLGAEEQYWLDSGAFDF